MNAIILAAGMGTRFGELTRNNHKALFEVGGVPNIERTIKYLREFGIEDITIVTGYLGQLFNYLKGKYKCTLICNDKYNAYNNMYSMYLALDYLKDTYVIDADVVMLDNIFSIHEKSCYYTMQREKSENSEWIPLLKGDRVKKISVSSEYKPSLIGISYWNKNDCLKIKNEFSEYSSKQKFNDAKLYWDDIPRSLLEDIYVTTKIIDNNLIDEMDNLDNYKRILNKVALKNKR